MAHPDDLEYGAAGAVAAWTSEGREIAYLLVTRGEAGIDGIAPDQAGPLRETDQRNGAAEAGVRTVEFLDHRDGMIEYAATSRGVRALPFLQSGRRLLLLGPEFLQSASRLQEKGRE